VAWPVTVTPGTAPPGQHQIAGTGPQANPALGASVAGQAIAELTGDAPGVAEIKRALLPEPTANPVDWA